MIELITGTPGSGKTTFAVAERLAVEVAKSVPLDNDTCAKLGLDPGTVVPRRMVVAGIRGLALEHERLPHLLTRDATSPAEVAKWNAMRTERDPVTGKEVDSDDPLHVRLPGEPPRDVPALMQNWWLWCKPGDLIVIDEAQFVMPRGTLGRKPPFWLQAMEIHRHYGVDFLIITQHPQLIDTTVRALVGLHRHVRSVMGSNVCMVYTWDHASNPERYQMASKATFVRRAAHFKLFHSSVAHVKPPTAGRWGLVAAPVLLVVGLGGLAFKVSALGGDADKGAGAAKPPIAASAPAAAMPAAQSRPRGYVDVPKLVGCYALEDRCECFAEGGRKVRLDLAMCRLSASSFDGLVAWEPRRVPENAPKPEGPPSAQGPAPSPVPFLRGSGAAPS